MKYTLIFVLLALSISTIFAATTSRVAGAGETACQAHAKREKASSTRLPGRVIPECDSAGNYMPKQCHSDKTVSGKQWCGCWAANGDIIANASTKIKQCNCMLEKDSKTKSKAADVPVCEASGEYKKMQCVADSCKCVDPITGKPTQQGLTRTQASTQCQ